VWLRSVADPVQAGVTKGLQGLVETAFAMAPPVAVKLWASAG
jgi:hypothetical protein